MDEDGRGRVEIDETLAARLAVVRRREHIRGLRKREWVFLSILLVLALGAYANFKRVIVNGHSMEPTFHDGESVLVWKFAPHDKLRPGDVIVFRQGRDDLIKRIVFIADSRRAGQMPPPGFPVVLLRNGPPWMTFAGYFLRVQYGITPAPGPNRTLYVMGDNYNNSDDSRDFGPVDPAQIVGKVIR